MKSIMKPSLNSIQAAEFRESYQIQSGTNGRQKQKDLIDEEWIEFHDAHYHEPLDHVLKELADLVYVCYQYAANEGWDLDEAMDRVHKSNMSKLDEDGKPLYRADGKVLKGPNYQPPNLKDLIENA